MVKIANDFYIIEKNWRNYNYCSKDLIYCGIGLNLKNVSDDFGKLDIDVDIEDILKSYFSKLEKKILWKQIFSELKINSTIVKSLKQPSIIKKFLF